MRLRLNLPFPLRAAPTPASIKPVARKRYTGIDYDTEWARTFSARLARVALLEGVAFFALVICFIIGGRA